MASKVRVSKGMIRRGRISSDNIIMGNVVKGGRIRVGSSIGRAVLGNGIVRAIGAGGMAYGALMDLANIYRAGAEVGKAMSYKPVRAIVRAIERDRLGFLKVGNRDMGERQKYILEGLKVKVNTPIKTGVYTRQYRSVKGIERIGRSVDRAFSGGIVPRSGGVVKVVNKVNPYVPDIVGMPKMVEGIR